MLLIYFSTMDPIIVVYLIFQNIDMHTLKMALLLAEEGILQQQEKAV